MCQASFPSPSLNKHIEGNLYYFIHFKSWNWSQEGYELPEVADLLSICVEIHTQIWLQLNFLTCHFDSSFVHGNQESVKFG